MKSCLVFLNIPRCGKLWSTDLIHKWKDFLPQKRIRPLFIFRSKMIKYIYQIQIPFWPGKRCMNNCLQRVGIFRSKFQKALPVTGPWLLVKFPSSSVSCSSSIFLIFFLCAHFRIKSFSILFFESFLVFGGTALLEVFSSLLDEDLLTIDSWVIDFLLWGIKNSKICG